MTYITAFAFRKLFANKAFTVGVAVGITAGGFALKSSLVSADTITQPLPQEERMDNKPKYDNYYFLRRMIYNEEKKNIKPHAERLIYFYYSQITEVADKATAAESEMLKKENLENELNRHIDKYEQQVDKKIKTLPQAVSLYKITTNRYLQYYKNELVDIHKAVMNLHPKSSHLMSFIKFTNLDTFAQLLISIRLKIDEDGKFDNLVDTGKSLHQDFPTFRYLINRLHQQVPSGEVFTKSRLIQSAKIAVPPQFNPKEFVTVETLLEQGKFREASHYLQNVYPDERSDVTNLLSALNERIVVEDSLTFMYVQLHHIRAAQNTFISVQSTQ